MKYSFFSVCILLILFSAYKSFKREQVSVLNDSIKFIDATKTVGLYDILHGIHGHAAAWGDINNDGYPDLFVGTFASHEDSTYEYRGHPASPAPNKLFLNIGGKKFIEVSPSDTEVFGVCSGAVFADFDNDGFLDLVVSHLSVTSDKRQYNWVDNASIGQSNKLYKNDGTGKMIDATENSGLVLNSNGTPSSARNIFVLDYDGDGLIDILLQEDDVWDWSIGNSRLLRNIGNLKFEDVTRQAGLPEHLHGLGGFVGDINGDTWPDIFFAHSSEMYINNQDGTFRKLDEHFIDKNYTATPRDGNQIWTCGANIGDLNGDGLIDFIVGDHFQKDKPHRIFVYINKGNDDKGNPIFEDVTDRAGIQISQTKQPHVEIEDFNNDGRMDILISSRDAFTYSNSGNSNDGIPLFVGPFESSAPKEGLSYWPCGPVADYNRDGKMDFFGAQWYSVETSVLLKNVTETSNNYITFGLNIDSENNRNGIGATIEIYQFGKIEENESLIGKKVISVANGYSSGTTTDAHFGTSTAKKIDLLIRMPCDGNIYKLSGIPTNKFHVVNSKFIRKYQKK